VTLVYFKKIFGHGLTLNDYEVTKGIVVHLNHKGIIFFYVYINSISHNIKVRIKWECKVKVQGWN
jgi:hypothetical protein